MLSASFSSSLLSTMVKASQRQGKQGDDEDDFYDAGAHLSQPPHSLQGRTENSGCGCWQPEMLAADGHACPFMPN